MPIYEYECRACRHQFELLVRDPGPQACPACHSDDLERLLSSFRVSSDATRQSALRSGRKQQAKTQRDKAIADHEEAHHAHDH